jgi:hypothetical protein
MTPILIAALLLVPAAQDDAFCGTLKQIVAAAPDDYGAITGERDDSGGLSVRVKPEIEGGWNLCSVVPRMSGSTMPATYICGSFSTRAPTDAEVAALANRAAGCFGAEVHADEYPEVKALGYPADRTIRLAPFEILVRAQRNDTVSGRGWHKLQPYLAARPAHSYSLTLQVRPVQH